MSLFVHLAFYNTERDCFAIILDLSNQSVIFACWKMFETESLSSYPIGDFLQQVHFVVSFIRLFFSRFFFLIKDNAYLKLKNTY